MDIAGHPHWENINSGKKKRSVQSKGIRAWLGRPPARDIFYRISDRFLNPDSNAKVFEVGCAPGRRLIEFADRYKYDPYGVEYTNDGVECTRAEFEEHGIAQGNCMHSDFFDKEFQNNNREKFDVVISFGFIEHFTNVSQVVDAHTNLLKENGILLIMIPNLRGIYYPLTKWLAPCLIPKHNLSIMRKKVFLELFKKENVEQLFCGYYGVLNFGILQGRGKIKAAIVRLLQIIQTPINPILRYWHRFENRITSPYLLFIGRKIKKSNDYE